MDRSINNIYNLQNNIINRDCNCDDIGELHKCMASVREVILKHKKKYKNNLIMGDFNIDILNHERINQ